jgi:hypothetical protein
VGAGAEVVELLPQLSSSVVITKASTGATTKHFFCHIKHPAMPWALQRCQAEPRENQTNLPWKIDRAERSRFAIESAKQERRASREGGDSPIPAHSPLRLAADIIRLPGGVGNRSAACS